MRIPRAVHFALAAFIAQPATAVPSKEKPKPSPPVFGAGVTVVTLPVFVTDKEGKPVGGLTAADFEVQDEGKPVRLVGLEEIDAARPVSSLEGLSPRLALAARRQFLMLFDLSFTSVGGIVRSREAAKKFVRELLSPSDLAAVATFSVRAGMKMLVGFTSDREQLEQAIDDLGVLDMARKTDPFGLLYDSRLNRPQSAAGPRNDREGTLFEMLQEFKLQYDRSQEDDYRRQVGVLTGAMSQLGRMLDAIQGRKQLIYLSAGFEEKSLVGAQGDQAIRDGQAVAEGRLWDVQTESRFGDAGLRNQMEGMLRALASSDTVVHTMDVTGLATAGDASLEGDNRQAIGTGRESLSQIAAGTGGRFYKDANDLGKAFDELLDATRRYYVLAFEPEALKGPGKYHKLRVRIREKGHKVSYRVGYTERNPEASPAALRQLEGAEAIAKGLSGGPIGLEALALPYRNAVGRISVPVILQVDGRSLLDRGPGTQLALEVFGYAFDEAGKIEDMVALASTLELSKLDSKLQKTGLLVQATFNLSPGRHSLRFMVRDGEKQRGGVHALDVEVPLFIGGERVLYPPLFMEDPASWLVVQATSRSGAPVETPLRVGDDAFAPRIDVNLVNGKTDKVCVMTYDGGKSYEPGAQFQIGAQLINAEGTPVRIGKVALAQAVAELDGFRRFVLNVTPQDVPSGEYTFKVKLTDPADGAVSEAIQPVRVE